MRQPVPPSVPHPGLKESAQLTNQISKLVLEDIESLPGQTSTMKKQTYVQGYVRTKGGSMKVNDADGKYVVDRHMLPAATLPNISRALIKTICFSCTTYSFFRSGGISIPSSHATTCLLLLRRLPCPLLGDQVLGTLSHALVNDFLVTLLFISGRCPFCDGCLS